MARTRQKSLPCENSIIIGSGPAALTAALYTARANLQPLVVTGSQLGGQLALTYDIENYPGFPNGSGLELINIMKIQAEKFGARIVQDVVLNADFSINPFRLTTGNGQYIAYAVIVTTGATPRFLNVPGEAELIGKGVSYCGTCDGFFFRDKEIVVVGGGDSAIKEALFLTRFASHVTVVHRRKKLKAEATLKERAFSNNKISFIWNTVVERISGESQVNNVHLHTVGEEKGYDFPTDGIFIFIGHEPNNTLFQGQLELDSRGYIVTDSSMKTSIEGVFAAGEIQDPVWKQVVTSAGQGCMAALAAEKWLNDFEIATPKRHAAPKDDSVRKL